MANYQTWRDLLSTLIEKPRERARLAKRLGVSALTLQSWTTREATPQPQQQQLLLQALPQHAMLLRALLAEEFHDLASQDISLDSSLANFSAHIFAIHASAPDESRYWSICTAILSEAVKQFDSRQPGISLSVIQCMTPPQAGNVRYLRECASLLQYPQTDRREKEKLMPPLTPGDSSSFTRSTLNTSNGFAPGTSPWSAQIEFRTSFLGAESLAGQAVATMHPQISADCRRDPAIARHLPENAASAIALPILHNGRVAGCLLASSAQPGYFESPERVDSLQNYTALLKLAFSPEDFYLPEQVELQNMPALQTQWPYLSSFQQRLRATLRTAFTGDHSLSYREAQHYVWGQIAEELLQLQTP